MADRPRPRPAPIAVIGISALLPGGGGPAGFWRNVLTGRDLITDVPATHWQVKDYYDPSPSAPDKTYGRRGAFLDPIEFDPLFFGVPPAAMPATDTTQLLALLAARDVLTDAFGPADPPSADRTSVILGTSALELLGTMGNRLQRPVWMKSLLESGVAEPQALAICDRIAEHYVPWQEATFPGVLSNVVAGRIANKFDFHGTNCTVDAACASSLAAISMAVNELALGQADLAITGGVDTLNDIVMYMCFSKTPALSPSGDCRPFSANADGTLLGEGLVMFALKRLSDAEHDGDHIYAVLRGLGSSSDGRSTAIYAPLPAGQTKALRRAYDNAGYGPETVELVEAHGTGTEAGDAAELAALHEVFTSDGETTGPWCALGSSKSQLGHTKSAAGAVGLLKAILAVHQGVLPPTLKVTQPTPALNSTTGPLYVNTQARPWIRGPEHPRRASVSSFGFGGSNFHLTLEEYPATSSDGHRAPRLRAMSTELLLLSADEPHTLAARARELTADETGLEHLARQTQRSFRHDHRARLALLATDDNHLSDQLGRAAELLDKQPSADFSAPSGIHYRTAKHNLGKTCLLFSGQGSQHVGMGADVAMQFPEALAVWDTLATIPFDGQSVRDVVHPIPVFDDDARQAQHTLLTRTEWAQPALAIQSLALLTLLTTLGVRADSMAGHSFGELTALHAAGVLDADTLVRLARRRGELMRDASSVPGAMSAINLSADELRKIVDVSGLPGLWIANHNSPHQAVVSGETDSIAALEQQVTATGVTIRRLNAATGFHSPLVASARDPLLSFLNQVDIQSPMVPVYGNADGQPYPSDPDQIRRRIADHLCAPSCSSTKLKHSTTAASAPSSRSAPETRWPAWSARFWVTVRI